LKSMEPVNWALTNSLRYHVLSPAFSVRSQTASWKKRLPHESSGVLDVLFSDGG